MSDLEILALVAQCKSRSDVPWNVLVSEFAGKLVDLSGKLSEEELYSLLEIALVCYQKGYEEFDAHREAREVIERIRLRARQTPAT